MQKLKHQKPNYRESPPHLDPRDNRVHISPEYFLDRIRHQDQVDRLDTIRQWLVQVYESVTSDAFLKYHEGKLSEGQVKGYASKNYIMNLTNLMKKMEQFNKTDEERKRMFEFISNQSNQIIKEVILKYPQADAKANVRKLKKVISRPDNRQSDQFDLFLDPKKTNIQFKFKEDKNYSSEIMKCLNYVMEVTNQPLHQGNIFQTNFDGFNIMLESLFTYAGCPEFQKQFPQQAQNYLKCNNLQNKSELFQTLFIPSQKNKKELYEIFENHKKNIKQECNFKINQKVSNDIKMFTKEQIKAGLFRVPDSSVLRVMTKWAQELRSKFQNSRQLILKRVQLFKTKEGNFIELNSQQKKYLFKSAEQEEIRIKQVLRNLRQNFINMAAKLSVQDSQTLHANQKEANIGIFAAKSQMCIGKYMFCYLNEVIHSLMIIPKRAKQLLLKEKPGQLEGAQKIQSVNLVTFKIGDLMRSRCKGSQRHIIDVFKLFESMSENFPSLLKIVRVKDRLDQKDNDILVNVFFMNQIQCQIQMMVTSHIDPKQEHLNSFNHLIYELRRAEFGLIAECACIMVQHDPVIKNYFQRHSLSPKIKVKKKIETLRDNLKGTEEDEQNLEAQKISYKNLPFFCSICEKFDSNNNPSFYEKRINNAKFKECNTCYESFLASSQRLWLEELLREKFKDKEEFQIIARNFEMINNSKIKNIQQIEKINKALIISKKEDKPMPQYSQIIVFDSVVYIMSKETHQNTFQSKILLKLSPQDWEVMIKEIIILRLRQDSNYEIKSDKEAIKLIKKQNDTSNGIFLSNSFKAKQESIIQSNNDIIRQTYKKKKEILNITQREFTRELDSISKMESLKRIYASYNQINHLDFLQKMPNLTLIELSKHFIILDQNNIINLKELLNCKKLKNLRLSNYKVENSFNNETKMPKNQITEFSAISSLTSLETIEINKNDIKQISDINSLCHLTLLSLKQNEIQKIENLGGLVSLKELYLNMNRISIIQNLENLKNLIVLELNGNQIQKMENLYCLTKLEVLKINSNHIKKIQNIEKLTELKILTLDSSRISEIDNISTLNKLQMLSLDYNPIQKIQNLNNLHQLKQLRLVATKISRIQNLEELKNLKLLYLDYNTIKRLQNLQPLTQLQCLSLTIENLSKIKKLKTLNLNLNEIKTMAGIQQCKSLQVLSLIGNKITVIDHLKSLESLRTLRIKKNPIKSEPNKQQVISYCKNKRIEYEI